MNDTSNLNNKRSKVEHQASRTNFAEVLEVAALAGRILLENGAEISRVEDIMGRIATHFGVDSGNFFVLSNGIFTTGHANKITKSGGQASTYANVEFIPIKGIQLSKVVAVNRLSYDIAHDRTDLAEARERLEHINTMPPKPAWEQILGSGFGAAGFCAVFGGGWADCCAALVVGLLLYAFVMAVSGRYLSKIVSGVCNALVATLLCIVMWRMGFGDSLANIIIGAIMPLIPGVPFVNGVRDLANSDYLAGFTRLTDAMLGFFCIAVGVSLAFILDGSLHGGVVPIGMTVNPQTASLFWQAMAAFVGTAAFALLFGIDREHYVPAGVIGAVGWVLYLVLVRQMGATPATATLAAATLVCVMARMAAIPFRSPAQGFLLCGIFPLVPGAGIFWFTYYLTGEQFTLSLQSGWTAGKVAIAIVLGIILAMELPQCIFSHKHRTH
ncbi:MAG: threonine/serine exporter family protein [Muribaculaceae bacterium]|nr:threonine/serine exporter family protein [Muribaculaceae bacterium]